jgi:hypothetical protein
MSRNEDASGFKSTPYILAAFMSLKNSPWPQAKSSTLDGVWRILLEKVLAENFPNTLPLAVTLDGGRGVSGGLRYGALPLEPRVLSVAARWDARFVLYQWQGDWLDALTTGILDSRRQGMNRDRQSRRPLHDCNMI